MICPLLVALYKSPSLFAAYRFDRHTQSSPTSISIEEQKQVAIVCYPIRPYQPGQVEYQNRYWTARCCTNRELRIGERVRVVSRDVEEMALIVEPLQLPGNELFLMPNDLN